MGVMNNDLLSEASPNKSASGNNTDTQLESTLLPCPFCGGRAESKYPNNRVRTAYQCENRKRGCPVNMRTHYGPHVEARKQWNTRATSQWKVIAKDGLPTDEGVYLFSERVPSSGALIVETRYVKDGKWFCDWQDYLDDPRDGWPFDDDDLAWMPLPAPYQPTEGGQNNG